MLVICRFPFSVCTQSAMRLPSIRDGRHCATVYTPADIVLHVQASRYTLHTCASCYCLHTPSYIVLHVQTLCYSLHTCTSCCNYTPAHIDMCRHHASLHTCTSCYSLYTCRHCLTCAGIMLQILHLLTWSDMCRHHATVYTSPHFIVFPRSEWLCLLLLVASLLPLLLSLPWRPLYGYGCPAILQFQKMTTANKNDSYSRLSRIYTPCMTPADFLITWWLDRLMQSTDAGVMSTWNQFVYSIMSVVLCVCVMLQHKLHSWPMWSIMHQLWMWFYLGRRNSIFFMCMSDCRLPEFSENPRWSCQLLCWFGMEWLHCKMKAWS